MNELNIFNTIPQEEQKQLAEILDMHRLSYKTNETIYDTQNRILVIESGSARLMTTDTDVTYNIIQILEAGDIISKEMLHSTKNITYSVKVFDGMSVLSFDMIRAQEAITECPNAYGIFMTNLMNAVSRTASRTFNRITVSANRSIRKRLMEYFELQKNNNRSVKFKIPLSMAELADYIGADRSAMLRDMKKMRDERLKEAKNRSVTVYFG